MPACIKNCVPFVQGASCPVALNNKYGSLLLGWRKVLYQEGSTGFQTSSLHPLYSIHGLSSRCCSATHNSDINVVSIEPLLECVSDDPCVGLVAPTACVCNCGPVYHTLSQAPSLNGADTSATMAVATRLLDNINFHSWIECTVTKCGGCDCSTYPTHTGYL